MPRVVLITGATRGVGRGIAEAFSRRGDTLVVVGRSTDAEPNRLGLPGTLEEAGSVLRSQGSEVLTIRADLADPAEVERLAAEVLESHGTPDVLVNNAAATFIGGFLDIPLSRWRTAINLNLLAPVGLIQAFLPGMLDRDEGRIINVTSAAARTRDFPDSPVPQLSYAASKAALDSFTYGLLPDLEASGVEIQRRCAVCGYAFYRPGLKAVEIQASGWRGQHVFRIAEFEGSNATYVTETGREALAEFSNIKFIPFGRIRER